MERINAPGGVFVDGDPFNGVTGTMVTADWLNAVQEEIVSVIAAAAIPLDPDDNTQLLDAITTLTAALISAAAAASTNTARDYFLTES